MLLQNYGEMSPFAKKIHSTYVNFTWSKYAFTSTAFAARMLLTRTLTIPYLFASGTVSIFLRRNTTEKIALHHFFRLTFQWTASVIPYHIVNLCWISYCIFVCFIMNLVLKTITYSERDMVLNMVHSTQACGFLLYMTQTVES